MPSTTSRSIDDAAFPHITRHVLDIVCHSFPFAALGMRTVCRDWYNTINARLFHHVLITGNRSESVYATPAFVFVLSPQSIAHMVAGASRSPPLLPTAATRILDIIAVPDNLVIKDMFPNLDAIRVEQGGFNSASSFDNASNPPEDIVVACRVISNYAHTVDHSRAKTVVLHVCNHDSFRIYFQVLPKGLDARAKAGSPVVDLTIFYPDHPQRPSSSWRPIPKDLLLRIASFSPAMKITLVAPGEDSPFFFRDAQISLWTELKSDVDLWNSSRTDKTDKFGNLDFLTADEYRARVGEDKYRIHAFLDTVPG